MLLLEVTCSLLRRFKPTDAYFWAILIAFSVKLLCIPCYYSTDFDVHRNWLAVTHSLPLKEWYYEETSEWTLDYPPFFAYFEFGMSKLAHLFDENMLEISEVPYRSEATVLFQRLSVIIFSDIPFMLASLLISELLYRRMEREGEGEPIMDARRRSFAIFSALTLSPGIIIVDNIHFQYNGILFAILLLFLLLTFRKQFWSAFLVFFVLLNFKHIFLYYSMPLFVFFCFQYQRLHARAFIKDILLAFAAVCVLALSLGPFCLSESGINVDAFIQIKNRLFPFQRGLTHAYWAPNMWALYLFVDKVLLLILKKLDISLAREALQGANTRGLVGSAEIMVLPNITPAHSLVAIVLHSFPALYMIATARKRRREIYILSAIYCAAIFFLFGWHVHEKAILMVIVPFTIFAFDEWRYFGMFFFISLCGTISLFPLLFEMHATYHIFLYIIAWQMVFVRDYESRKKPVLKTLFGTIEIAYMVGLILISMLTIYNPLQRFQFLPLMLISVYTALGIAYWTAKLFRELMRLYK